MAETKVFTGVHKQVYDTARSMGATDFAAKLVLSQLQHESSDFKSNVFKKNNNPMGMKFPSKRKSPYIAGKGTQPPGNEGATPYARYDSVEDAVKDLFHWLNYMGIKINSYTTIADYAEKLRQKSYFGNTITGRTIYIAGLSRWYNKIKDFMSKPVPFAIIALFIGITIYFLINKN